MCTTWPQSLFGGFYVSDNILVNTRTQCWDDQSSLLPVVLMLWLVGFSFQSAEADLFRHFGAAKTSCEHNTDMKFIKHSSVLTQPGVVEQCKNTFWRFSYSQLLTDLSDCDAANCSTVVTSCSLTETHLPSTLLSH